MTRVTPLPNDHSGGSFDSSMGVSWNSREHGRFQALYCHGMESVTSQASTRCVADIEFTIPFDVLLKLIAHYGEHWPPSQSGGSQLKCARQEDWSSAYLGDGSGEVYRWVGM